MQLLIYKMCIYTSYYHPWLFTDIFIGLDI